MRNGLTLVAYEYPACLYEIADWQNRFKDSISKMDLELDQGQIRIYTIPKTDTSEIVICIPSFMLLNQYSVDSVYTRFRVYTIKYTLDYFNKLLLFGKFEIECLKGLGKVADNIRCITENKI